MSMISEWMSKISPMVSDDEALLCPVDGCNVGFTASAPSVFMVGDRMTIKGVTIEAVETAVAAHMAMHTAVEFLSTIRARNLRIAELERMNQDMW